MQRVGDALLNLQRFMWVLRQPGQARHAMRLLRSLSTDYLLRTGTPWITFDAIEYLEQRLLPAPRVFEYGSGGSTLFWLRLGANLTSVEHDPAWYALVRHRLGITPQFDYRLVEPIWIGDTLSIVDPHSYGSDDPAFKGYSFRNYVRQIDEFPENYFDVVLVDGRARPACIFHAVSKVRQGGFLLLDNADRLYYTERLNTALKGFHCHAFVGAVPCQLSISQTNCYVKRA